MIDISKEIVKKFPSFDKKSPMIKKTMLKVAKKIIHEDNINKFLKENSHLEGFEFVDAVLEYFNFDFKYAHNELSNIPQFGRVVIISNHPLGSLDALCLLKLIKQVRDDIKIIANDFLASFKALESLLIKVDNFKSKQTKDSIKEVYKALENDEAVIIFPAGEVSRLTPVGIKDAKWQKGFLTFAKKTNSPILPIFIDGKNSKIFYTLSILNKTFSTILLSDEMFKQKGKIIDIKIGKLIPSDSIIPKNIDKNKLPSIYKKHLYSLKKGKKSFFQTVEGIALEESKKCIKKELSNNEILGKTNDGKIIYLYEYQKDSAVLKEIGRLREISFRQVNEGVNKKRDIDKYDKYYKHIILWDENELEIVGAYRIAIADDVLDEYGFEGFYSNTLFEFTNHMYKYLENGIELGRSFVQPKYWGSRALDYLWYGIGAFLKKNPHIRYMFGPVSLSAHYPQYAKELIVDFYSNYFKPKKKVVKAKIPFEYETLNIAINNDFSFDDYKKDFKILKEKLKSIDLSVPTLYKQYSELTEKGGIEFCDFNIDPNFSNCVDAFIIVDISLIKESKKKRYIMNTSKNSK